MLIVARNFKLHSALRRRVLTIACMPLFCVLSALPPELLAADAPAAGMFLIATHDLTGSSFSESVILLIQHDENGSMGVIINQPTDVDLSTILPEVDDDIASHVYVGGPVATYGLMLLIKSADELSNAEHVFGNIYASGNRELLLELLDSSNPKPTIRLYAGHAGWYPGQLDQEISRGSWRVAPASEGMIFAEDPLSIWKTLAPPPPSIIVRLTAGAPQDAPRRNL